MKKSNGSSLRAAFSLLWMTAVPVLFVLGVVLPKLQKLAGGSGG